MHVLVIDDFEPARLLLSAILVEIGFTVDQSSNSLEALDLIKKEKIDVAMVDWNMPEMSGYEFIQRVRKDDTYKDMRLIMVTANTEMNNVEEALEAGADEYIMKPFNKEIIIDKLALIGISMES